MYVEAICPLCFASHVVPEEMRGEKFRCEECEEVFVISKKAKRTNKKPPRPREVKPADEPEQSAASPEVAEVLPEAKLVDTPPRQKPRTDDEEVLEIPEDAVQGRPAVRTTPTPKRRRDQDEEDDDRPRKRRRPVDDEDDERPRKRPAASRSGVPVGLVVGLSAGAVLLLGLAGLGAWWALSGSGQDKQPAQAQVRNAPANNGPGQQAMTKQEARVEPPRQEPPRVEPPKAEPPRVEPPPPAQPPQKEPPRAEPPAVWTVKADPPAAPVKLPADFKKEIKAPGALAQVVFPRGLSPFVAIGSNLRPDDERQVWNLQTGRMTGKVVGTVPTFNGSPPVLSADGAYVAFHERPSTVAVWALGPGKKVSIEVGSAWALGDYVDFAGGKLLTLRRTGSTLFVQLWDPATGQNVLSFTALTRTTGVTRDSVAISPGGGYLAVVSHEGLAVYELKAGTAVGQRPLPKWGPTPSLTCHGLSFSPDGSELAGLFYGNVPPMHLVCWDVAKGDVVSEASVPQARPPGGTISVYAGHAIDWVGERRGWLLYGYTLVKRGEDGSATFLSQPQQTGSPVPRHLVGPDHVATLAAGALTVSRFDPDNPK